MTSPDPAAILAQINAAREQTYQNIALAQGILDQANQAAAAAAQDRAAIQAIAQQTVSVDTSVGTRVFAGDVMIHGDVSKRDLRGLLPEDCTAAAVHLSLDGNIVALAIVDLVCPVGGDVSFTQPLPMGFRPWPRHRFPLIGASHANLDTAGGVRIYDVAPNTSVNGTFSFRTPNSWPTELPGIAV